VVPIAAAPAWEVLPRRPDLLHELRRLLELPCDVLGCHHRVLNYELFWKFTDVYDLQFFVVGVVSFFSLFSLFDEEAVVLPSFLQLAENFFAVLRHHALGNLPEVVLVVAVSQDVALLLRRQPRSVVATTRF
jgi:hypothetical protein